MPRWNAYEKTCCQTDLFRFEKSYTLPKGRQRPSRGSIEHHFRLIKSIKNGGGLNEGINIVQHKKRGTIYVQKMLPTNNQETEREILFLNVLKHPNIITYIDAYLPVTPFDQSASLYLEYCELGTLHDLIKKYAEHNKRYPRDQAHMPEPFIWHVLESMASALQYIHHGIGPDGKQVDLARVWPCIVHRDIKPDNIFLRKSESCHYPEVVLADFGCASRHNEPDFSDKQGSFIGTPSFSPPECDRQVARADIWALGAVILSLCWLFARGPKESPVHGMSKKEWLMRPKFKKCIIDNGVGKLYSQKLDSIVGHCAQSKRENRPLAWQVMRMIESRKPKFPETLLNKGLPRWALEKS